MNIGKAVIVYMGFVIVLGATTYGGMLAGAKIINESTKGINKLKMKILKRNLEKELKKAESGNGNVVIFDSELRDILKNAKEV